MTFKEYKRLDLGIWLLMIVIFEGIATLASNSWFAAQPVSISITISIVSAVMMRWSWYAAMHAIAGGFAFCLASGATVEQYAIYCIGNLGALVSMILIHFWGKERIRLDNVKRTLLVIAAYTGAVFGRWGVSLIFDGSIETLKVFMMTDIVSLLFAVVVIHLLARLDGMIEDQKHYLLRIAREKDR